MTSFTSKRICSLLLVILYFVAHFCFHNHMFVKTENTSVLSMICTYSILKIINLIDMCVSMEKNVENIYSTIDGVSHYVRNLIVMILNLLSDRRGHVRSIALRMTPMIDPLETNDEQLRHIYSTSLK